MSTTENSHRVTDPVLAMVRAFGDEPVKLLANPVNAKVVEVASLDGEVTCGFAPAFVYEYDERAYRALVAAYERGDAGSLRSLWSAASHFGTA